MNIFFVVFNVFGLIIMNIELLDEFRINLLYWYIDFFNNEIIKV